MAFQVNDTTYSGKYASTFLMLSMFGMQTIDKGLVAIHGDIKKLKTLPRIQYTKPLKPRQAVPVANNGNPFILDGRQLIPKSADVYEEYNPRDLEENQLAEALSATVLAREVPTSLQNQLIQLTLNRAAEQYENCMWQGSEAYATGIPESDPRYQLQFFNGFFFFIGKRLFFSYYSCIKKSFLFSFFFISYSFFINKIIFPIFIYLTIFILILFLYFFFQV